MKKLLTVMALCLVVMGVQAQDTLKYFREVVSFENRNSIKGIHIRKPLIIDSLNNKQKAFSIDNYFVLPSFLQQKKDGNLVFNKIKADDGVLKIKLDTTKDGYSVHQFFFQITNSSFTKGKISVYSTEKIIIGLNDNETGKRMSRKDSLNEDAKVSFEATLEPGSHLVSLSVFCENDKSEALLQVLIDIPNVNVSEEQSLKRGFVLPDILEGERPYGVEISGNGEHYLVKYVISTIGEKNKYRTDVHQTTSGEILWSNEEITSAKWLHLGAFELDSISALYYIKGEGKNRKLYCKIFSGDKSFQNQSSISVPEGRLDFKPDLKEMIVTITEKEDNSKDDLRQLIHPDDRIGNWRNRTNLALYNIEQQFLQPLTFGHHNVRLNDINEDNKRILISVEEEDITTRPYSKTTILEMNLTTLDIDTIVSDSYISRAQYLKPSEDKTKNAFAQEYIIVQGSAEAFNSCGAEIKKGQIPNVYHNLLFLVNKESKQVKPLLKGFTPSANSFKIITDNRIYITTTDKDSINVYYYDFDTLYKLPLQVDMVGGFDVDMIGQYYVYFGQNYNKSDKVFLYNVEQKETSEIAYPKRDMNEELALGEMRVWNFKHKGDLIEGRYYLPADFDSTKQYPMIVYYYAGTTPTDRTFEMRYSAYLYTAQGYVVYMLNPSGTIGYGQEFAARHVNAWGEKTADEIIYGVKLFCKQHSFVNAKKIGCMGASYGGFMTQLLQTKTDIFAAAVSHAGISDITSYWGEGYWGYSYSAGASANSYPWNNRSLYVDRSPLFAADKINTPLLLLHGTDDTNVPIGESIQMFNALKILGKEVEFITVKGENHGIVDHKKRIKWNNTIYAWFAKWLQDDDAWWKELYPKKDL